jgi:hypothetical protein
MTFNEVLKELELLSDARYYSRAKIVWWLIKYEELFIGLSKTKNTLEIEFPKSNLRKHKEFIKELLFLELYSDLDRIFNNDENQVLKDEQVDLCKVINKIKNSTNGLNRKDKNFKWNTEYR